MTSDSTSFSEDKAWIEAGKRARAEAAKTYLTGSEVQSMLAIDAEALALSRRDRQLLGVWHAPDNAWLYPDFQFKDGTLIEQMPALLATFGQYYEHAWENTWSIVEWFMTPHTLLGDDRPMDLMGQHPNRVLGAARREFSEDPATLW